MHIGQYNWCFSSRSSDFDNVPLSLWTDSEFALSLSLEWSSTLCGGEAGGSNRLGSTTQPFWELPQHEKNESIFLMLAPVRISLVSNAMVFLNDWFRWKEQPFDNWALLNLKKELSGWADLLVMLKFFSIASRNGLLPMRNLLSAQASAPQFASKRFVSSEGSGKELSESAQPSSAEIEPFDFKPSRPEMVLILRNLAKVQENYPLNIITNGVRWWSVENVRHNVAEIGSWQDGFYSSRKPARDQDPDPILRLLAQAGICVILRRGEAEIWWFAWNWDGNQVVR
jgi:hypothetical protein